jgi:predicted nucleotidyltransferase
MRRGAVIAVLRAHEAELKWLGVQHLFVFGSTVRDEARDVSDVDLFFDHPEGSMGLFGFMEVKDVANRILGYRADILTRRSLHPVLRSGIEASAQQIF